MIYIYILQGYIVVLAAILAFASASLVGIGVAPGIGLAGIPRAGIIGVPGVVAGPAVVGGWGVGAHGILG